MTEVNVNDIELHYREAGEGFPIVLIHGYTGNLRNWALTVPALRDSYRTISVDLRGHGQSAKPTQREDYTPELMAADVLGLLSELNVREYLLVGHSMGGMVAQHVSLAEPQGVRALVLVDTAAELPKTLLYGERTKQRERLITIAREQGMEAAFDEQLRITPVPEVFKANPKYIEIWREQFLMTSLEAYVHCAHGMRSRRSLVDELRNIDVPTLIICGEKDEPFLEPSYQMHEAIRGSELAIIPGAGHGPQMETPGEFNRVLTEFLSKVDQMVAAGS